MAWKGFYLYTPDECAIVLTESSPDPHQVPKGYVMMSPKRPLLFLNMLLALLIVGLISPALTFAQTDPATPIIDAAYKDLSAKLGVGIVRQGDTSYSFEQDVFPDSSLGCPQPGQAYSQIVTKGYKILITYPRGGAAYDYRA